MKAGFLVALPASVVLVSGSLYRAEPHYYQATKPMLVEWYEHNGTTYFNQIYVPNVEQTTASLLHLVSVDEEPLGVGGNAVIYSGRMLDSKHPVAIKMSSKLATGQDTVARALGLAQEVAIMKTVTENRCRNCIAFEGVVVEPNHFVVLMELAKGHSLYDHFQRHFTERQVRAMMRQLFEGLGDIHELGIVHRDINSRNVLLTAKGELRICDFGSAAYLTQIASGGSHQHAGTVLYHPPELAADGCGWTEKADIWAAGLTFYSIITKQPLKSFSKDQPMRGCSQLLQNVITACLQEDPEKRLGALEILELPFFATAMDDEWESMEVAHQKPDYSKEGDQQDLQVQREQWQKVVDSHSPSEYEHMKVQATEAFIFSLSMVHGLDLKEILCYT